MSELNIVIDNYNHKELREYLMSLKGVKFVKINNNRNLYIYLKYDSKLITAKIIKMEILVFLDIKIPSIISFNKYPKLKTADYTIIKKDLCCEYCFKNAIEELFEIDGIEKVESSFTDEYFLKKDGKRENIVINIKYNPNILDVNKIKQIELKLTI